ncbi:MAG TPA: response regulator [Pyrinomonadaceae bacterium]|nr:response regulator [Pyrinomonadaceae bacterium]
MSNSKTGNDRINILMVDDSATNLLALESILRAPDRNLIRAGSGEDALRYLLDNDAAVVLLDVYMPGIDGLQTAELIRGRERSRDIPIIFLTANTTGHAHLSRGYSLGAVDYIVKPIEPAILRSKVNVFVELFKKAREIKRQAQLLEQQNREIKNANLERLRSLIDLGHELAAEHEPATVLRKFCRSAQRVIDAEEVTIVMLGDDEKTPRHFFRCDRHARIHGRGAMPEVIQEALRRVLTELAPVRLDESSELLIADDNPIESFLGAPILSAGVILGWFYFLNRRGQDHFSESDESLAATLANHVAVAYENARLYAEAQNHATELRMEMAVRRQAEEERAHLLVREQAARAEAEAANKNKDEFLATLSHELRTPLTAVLGWSHLLQTKKLSEPETNRALDTIERNARAQSQLIDDLLDVSRIITGKLSIDRTRVDLCRVIEGALDVTRPLAEAKDVQFTIEIEPSPCFVLGDSTRLQQIFWNLFSNAVKFTPKGGRVVVDADTTSSRVTVAVRDTGIGIKPELLPFIFERFRQGDGSTTREHGGLGLGLAIVRHLVQLHGGFVDVESDGIECGTTFKVAFPLAIEDVIFETKETDVASTQSVCAPALSLQLLNGIKVLVVDDEHDSRELLMMILTRCGSDVRCSDSAASAIEAFNEWHPDLLVSDIGMPNEDGYSLIQKVRSMDSNHARQIPAVALTAYATDEDRLQALSAGFQMHVPKPIEPESFVNSLASVLGREMSVPSVLADGPNRQQREH